MQGKYFWERLKTIIPLILNKNLTDAELSYISHRSCSFTTAQGCSMLACISAE